MSKRAAAAPKKKKKATAPRKRAPSTKPLEYNILLTATLCLLAFGAVMVYSASSARTALQGGDAGTEYLIRYVAYGAVGLAALYAISRRGLDILTRITGPLLLVAFVLLVAVRIPGVGVSINGAQRWLGAGPLQFQPSEVAKLALLLYGVKFLAEKPSRVTQPRLLMPLLGVTGVGILLVATQPDLGTALVLSFTTGCLLIAAGLPFRHLFLGAGAGAGLVLLFALIEPYRRARLTAFLDPWETASTTGFQSVQSQIALGSGGFSGLGIGESVQKVFYLPEAHTDFILAVIGEELGVIGISMLLFLYGLLAYAGLRVAQKAHGRYAQLLAAGVTSLILCQGLLNVFAVLGLAPLTGVPLPFISYGSTNLIILLVAMGLLLNVADGGRVRLKVVAGSKGASSDRSRRDGRTRGAGPGGRRRAAS
ncbi:MAG: putative lipid II flippase FtsW [Solirubrobacteraceae bacterium]